MLTLHVGGGGCLNILAGTSLPGSGGHRHLVLECSQQRRAASDCCGLDRQLCHFPVLLKWFGLLGEGMDAQVWMDPQPMIYVNY